MQQYKMLILTDHSGHSSENSLYALARALVNHDNNIHLVDIANRAVNNNGLFFNEQIASKIWTQNVNQNFNFQTYKQSFQENLKEVQLSDYDAVWLRLPPPLSESFVHFLKTTFPTTLFINDPAGILETGSKAFLLNFPDCCPPMKLCQSRDDVISFSDQFPIVLKPLRDFGGRGIVRIDGNEVWEGNNKIELEVFLDKFNAPDVSYLGVQFLKNVKRGDKRIVVVNGKIMGASLRLPPEDSWICNVAMGGTSVHTKVEKEEIEIISKIDKKLADLGIVMYGVDTLVGDDDKRILSEINTTSIGGLPQIAKANNQPLVEEFATILWNYIDNNLSN